VSFTTDRDKATDQANQANILVSEMTSYEDPVKIFVQDTNDVSQKMRALSDQIDEMYNMTQEADDHANVAEILTFDNKKRIDANILNVIKNATDHTNDNIVKADELNTKSRSLFDEAEFNFSHMS
jgi:laminin alpha 3/5